MKNLLVFISPTKSFDNPRHDIINDAGVSAKIQIENSLELGWTKDDIMLITNFKYEYAGIEATILDDVDFFDRKPQASKINAIIKLFENETIKDGEIYWFHDLDAFQLCTIAELEIDLGSFDMALSDYGVNPRWSTGVIYFKKSAKDIFEKIRDVTYEQNIDEERALTHLTRNYPKINTRVKKISKSYNFTPRCLKSMYATILKPLRVIHFHPLGEAWRTGPSSAFNFCKGENPQHIQLMTTRLLKIFNFHRIK